MAKKPAAGAKKKRTKKTVEFSRNKAGLPITHTPDEKIVMGIPKSAFFENVPEAPEKDADAKVKTAYREAKHAAKVALATYIRDCAEARLVKIMTVADPKAKRLSKLEKLRKQIAELEEEDANAE